MNTLKDNVRLQYLIMIKELIKQNDKFVFRFMSLDYMRGMINMKEYCPYCHKDVECRVERRPITEFKGVKINTFENVGVCTKCQKDLYVFDLEDANIKRLYKVYRKTANIVEPHELVNLRNKYNISQRELTSILGFGKMTINRYENGDMPTKSQSDYLRFLIDNEGKFVEKVKVAYEKNSITKKTFNKIMTKYNSENTYLNEEQIIYKKVINLVFMNQPDMYNGYKQFDLERLENVISYIASKVKNLTLTSLNKYLWFIDMVSFGENALAITGIRYQKQQFGPVIAENMYNELSMLNDMYYREDYENENGMVSIIKSKNNYDLSLFKDYELKVINKVIRLLKNKTVSEISYLSHEEDGWKKTKNKDYISFEYAMNLKINK